MPRESRDVVFVDGVRTPFGKAGSLYSETRADDLVVSCIRALLRRHPELPPERVDEVAIAATTQTGDQGLTIGRTAALLAGLPTSVPGYAIDRMCAGAMTAVTTTASGIAFGAYDVAVAGGVEHMGHHPMGEGIDPNPRIVAEKLVDPSALVMGSTAENLHDRFPGITRERADEFALQSQQRVATAYADGVIQESLVPIGHPLAPSWAGAWPPPTSRRGRAPRWRGCPSCGPRSAPTAGSPPATPPASTTAPPPACWPPSRSPPSWTCRWRCGWCRTAFAGVDPEVMGVGPVPATEQALRNAGLTIDDIGAFEINEAFAVQVLAFLDHFGLDPASDRINPYGGAIALGHPLASSGVRLMIHLARAFREHPEVRYGLTTMCIGLGMGGTVIWENPHHTRRPGRRASERRDAAADARGRAAGPAGRGLRADSRRAGDPVPQPRRRAAAQRPDGGVDHPGQRRGPHQAEHARPAQPDRVQRRARTPPWLATTSPPSRSPASRSSWPPAPTSRRWAG